MQIKSKSGRVFDLPSDEEDAAIKAGITADPDTYEMTDEELKKIRPIGRPKAEVTKESITIRLDPEVLDYFRATGKGWQTRLNEILKEYIASHTSV